MAIISLRRFPELIILREGKVYTLYSLSVAQHVTSHVVGM